MITVKNRNSRPASMLFDPFFFGGHPSTRPQPKKSLSAKILTNIIRTENGFDIELAAPGFQKDDLHIDVEKNQLKITFTKKEAAEKITYVKQEFAVGTFSKTFNLPSNIDVEKISASYDLGILKVSLENAEKIVKTINVQ